MVLTIKDHIDHCFSNSDGEVIGQLIREKLQKNEKVIISFKDIDSVTSSFINSALIDLLDQYSFDFIKSHVGFINSTRQINELIKRRFVFEVNERNRIQPV